MFKEEGSCHTEAIPSSFHFSPPADTGTKTNPAPIVGDRHRNELSVCIVCSPPHQACLFEEQKKNNVATPSKSSESVSVIKMG